MIAGSFTAGAVVGTTLDLIRDFPGLSPIIEATPAPTQDWSDEDSMDVLFAPFWESWDIVHEYYIDQPVDDTSDHKPYRLHPLPLRLTDASVDNGCQQFA